MKIPFFSKLNLSVWGLAFLKLLATALLIEVVCLQFYQSQFKDDAGYSLLKISAAASLYPLIMAYLFKCSSKIHNETTKQLYYAAYPCMAMLMIIPVMTTLATVKPMLDRQYLSRYEIGYKKFVSDSDGYGALKRFARDYYDTEITLENPEDASEFTSKKSYGYVDFGWGFCRFGLNTEGLNKENPLTNKAEKYWLKVVAFHELGHCLDISRDYKQKAFNQSAISIAPNDKKDVHDLDSYYHALIQPSTKKWHEIQADSFAVGYMRMTYPDVADQVINALLAARLKHAKEDADHNTACWMQIAKAKPLPSNERMLLAWADEVRNSTDCKL